MKEYTHKIHERGVFFNNKTIPVYVQRPFSDKLIYNYNFSKKF